MVHSKLKFKGGAGGGGGGSADGGGHGDALSDEEVMTQIAQLQQEDADVLKNTIQNLKTQLTKRREEIRKIKNKIYDENDKRISRILARDDTNKETYTRRIKALKTLLNQKLTAISVLADEINKLVPEEEEKQQTAGGRTRHRNTRSSKKSKKSRTKKYRR